MVDAGPSLARPHGRQPPRRQSGASPPSVDVLQFAARRNMAPCSRCPPGAPPRQPGRAASRKRFRPEPRGRAHREPLLYRAAVPARATERGTGWWRIDPWSDPASITTGRSWPKRIALFHSPGAAVIIRHASGMTLDFCSTPLGSIWNPIGKTSADHQARSTLIARFDDFPIGQPSHVAPFPGFPDGFQELPDRQSPRPIHVEPQGAPT